MNKLPLWSLVGIGLIGVVGAVYYYFLLPEPAATVPRVYRVGVLSGLDFFADITDGFKARMAELGYLEGRDIVYDIQRTASPVGNEQVIRKFVDDGVDLIFVFPTEASLEVKAVTDGTNIPVVFGTALLEGNDLVVNVREPAANVTGVQYGGTDIAVKRLEMLHDIAPQVRRVLVPYLKGYPTVPPLLVAIGSIAPSLGVSLVEAPFSSEEGVRAYFAERAQSPDIEFDAILQIIDPYAVIPTVNDLIWTFADLRALPVVGAAVTQESFGPIIGYAPNNVNMGRLAAPLADKIFKGIPAGTIPIVSPEGDLRVNYKVVKKLGLTVGADLLSRASEIVR